MTQAEMQDDIFRVGVCTECKQETVLDSNRDICWDCWCLIDLEAHDKLDAGLPTADDVTEEE